MEIDRVFEIFSKITYLSDKRVVLLEYDHLKLNCEDRYDPIVWDGDYFAKEYSHLLKNKKNTNISHGVLKGKVAYLYHLIKPGVLVGHVAAFINHPGFKRKSLSFCHTCHYYCNSRKRCFCEGQVKVEKKSVTCQTCGSMYKAYCPCKGICEACKFPYHGKLNLHRCPIYMKDVNDNESKQTFYPPDSSLGKPKGYSLWAWDIECSLVKSDTIYTEEPQCDVKTGKYLLDEENRYVTSREYVKLHVPMLIICMCVIQAEGESNEPKFLEFRSMDEFLKAFYGINKGKNVLVAHNGKGYDTRAVLSKILRDSDENIMNEIHIIPRGSKIMQLKVKDLIFRDSMCFLPGSLSALAKSFQLSSEKGYFPHLFNTEENYNYEGNIPDIKYFSMHKIAKKDSDYQGFLKWHSEFQGAWNFQNELVKYCRNDVYILAKIMYVFHDTSIKKYKVSPWHSVTGPSFVHNAILRSISRKITDEMGTIFTPEERFNFMNRALEKYWPVLQPFEYWIVRKALRGGRTDTRCLHYKLSDEEIARGCQIKYVDVVSLYPSCQLFYDYPIGTPKIYIFDERYLPCKYHYAPTKMNTFNVCDCVPSKRLKIYKCQIVERLFQPRVEEILSDDFFGVIFCDVKCPTNLYHPVLVHYDESTKKCIASLEDKYEEAFTSIEIQKAIRKGYTVTKVYRMDYYKKAKGLWNDELIDLFVDKTKYGKNTQESISEMIDGYRNMKEEVADDIADAIERSIRNEPNEWREDAARKVIAKTLLNSTWGKNVQRPVLPTHDFIHRNSEKFKLFRQKVIRGLIRVEDYSTYDDDVIKISTTMNQKTMSNRVKTFSGGFLTAGLFVPAYGRLVLYDQLEKLDERVLYHDTDSIIYIYDPEKYNVRQGKLLGQWEEEDVSKNGNIIEYASFGPKSYALRTKNGDDVIKIKGISLKAAMSEKVNFQEFKRFVFERFFKIIVPQEEFKYSPLSFIVSRTFQKVIEFDENNLKGTRVGNKIYPKGYVF